MRLKKRREFLAVAATRQKWVTPGLILQVRQHDKDESFCPSSAMPETDKKDSAKIIRVGFTTSKKVGSAVERNRARRRLRALAAEILPGNAASGVDLVLIGRRNTLTRDWEKLRGDLMQSIEKLGLKS